MIKHFSLVIFTYICRVFYLPYFKPEWSRSLIIIQAYYLKTKHLSAKNQIWAIIALSQSMKKRIGSRKSANEFDYWSAETIDGAHCQVPTVLSLHCAQKSSKNGHFALKISLLVLLHFPHLAASPFSKKHTFPCAGKRQHTPPCVGYATFETPLKCWMNQFIFVYRRSESKWDCSLTWLQDDKSSSFIFTLHPFFMFFSATNWKMAALIGILADLWHSW